LKLQQRQQFVARVLAGEKDFSLTSEELESREVYETR